MRAGLDKLVGLNREKQKAKIAIRSCLTRGVVFPHTLITSIGGCGKTALARAMAEELSYHIEETEAAALKTRKHIIQKLVEGTNAAQGYSTRLMLFVDEIHRLSIDRQEVFYIPMKEWKIATVQGIIKFPPFCLMGATTRMDLLDANSFVSRFPNKWHIRRYHTNDIVCILIDLFNADEISHNIKVVKSIARRCLGIPRYAHNLYGKVRDQVLFRGGDKVNEEDVLRACELEGIDSLGLGEIHLDYLKILLSANGKARGLSGLASKLMQPNDVVSGTLEPILLSLDFIDLESRGRILTDKGRQHLMAKKSILC
jgi:holliday junction DNA helicase RuvB